MIRGRVMCIREYGINSEPDVIIHLQRQCSYYAVVVWVHYRQEEICDAGQTNVENQIVK
jgi:hypothetical protein